MADMTGRTSSRPHSMLRRQADTTVLGRDTHDIEAAARAGCVWVLRCGGFWTDSDLRHASAIYDHLCCSLRRAE
jgi:hypothetical protein